MASSQPVHTCGQWTDRPTLKADDSLSEFESPKINPVAEHCLKAHKPPLLFLFLTTFLRYELHNCNDKHVDEGDVAQHVLNVSREFSSSQAALCLTDSQNSHSYLDSGFMIDSESAFQCLLLCLLPSAVISVLTSL